MDDGAARQLAQTLTFKVEAVPQEGVSPTRSGGNMTSLNVKIRVRKKEDGKNSTPKGIIFVPKSGQAENLSERLRLASSDHTILSFNMLMETEQERKRKSRKNTFFGNCLGAQTDDDDGPYLPTTDSRSESRFGMIKLKNTTPNEIGTSQALMRKNTNFFGVCKPGGCLDPPYGEDRYAYQPAPLKQTSRGENITKGMVIIPPIRIEPAEAVKIDTDERLRNSVVRLSLREITEKDADDNTEKDKNTKGKEVSKAERRLSSNDQDRNDIKIEKLRKTASSSRPQSNEFSTLFFSPPRKESSKDSGSSRRDSKLEQRRNTLEAVKTPIPLSRKDDKDKQKVGPKIEDKPVSGKQISSAPILILSNTETSDTTDENKSPESLPDRSLDERKVSITPRGEESATLPFPISDKNITKEHDSMQTSNQQEQARNKYPLKDTADVAKQRRKMPSAQLSDILSSDVTESQHDDIIQSGKSSLMMSPITEIIIPPASKIIKHSQTDDLVKRKSEYSGETLKYSTSQLIKNDSADQSKITTESTIKESVKIEKLRSSSLVKAKLPDDNSKATLLKNQTEAQQTDGSRISTKLSDSTDLIDIIKLPIPISKDNSDKEQVPGHDFIDGEMRIPVTITADGNQFQSKEDKKKSDKNRTVDHAEPDDLLKDKYRPSISSNRTDISVKTKNEDTQLQPDQPKEDFLFIAKNRDSNASDHKKNIGGEIMMQSHQLLNEEIKESPQLQEYYKKPVQEMIAQDVQKLMNTPVKQSEPGLPIIFQDSPKAKYQEEDDNQNQTHYPSTIQDTKITQAYDTNNHQFFQPKVGTDPEGKNQELLDDNQVLTKVANRDDPHYINLVFQKYTYENKTGIKTLDADSNFEPNENIVTYKSNSQAQDKKITIPIDEQNVVAIQIKKSNATGNDGKELLAQRSKTLSDSSKGEYEASTRKRSVFNEPQKDYTGNDDAGFELPTTKQRSVTEGRHDSNGETGAKVYSPKRSSISESRKASVNTRNGVEFKRPSTSFKDDKKSKTFDGNDLGISTKLSKRDSEYSARGGPSNKRGSFTPDRVDILGDRSGIDSKVTSPRPSVFNEERHVSADDIYGVEPIISTKWKIVDEGRSYSLDDRKSTKATTSPYERNSVKRVSILDANAKRSTLLSDTGTKTYLQKHISHDDVTDPKGEYFSYISSSNIGDIDKNDELNITSHQPSTISERDSLGRSGIQPSTTSGRDSLSRTGIDTSDDPRDFDDTSYGRNINYTNRTDTETDVPIFFDNVVPVKRISSFASKTGSTHQTPSISTFRQISLNESKRVSLDNKSEGNKRSFSYYGENRSGSTYGRNESGTRIRSSMVETYNEGKSDYTGDIDDDGGIGEIKYDSFLETRKVGSFIEDKTGRSSGALYPLEDDKASYSRADNRIHNASYSRSRSVEPKDTYINKRIPHKEGDKGGKGKETYMRSTDVNTDFQFSKNGSKGKIVKYSDEDDSRIAIIGREINRTLSFIYEHELIPLQHVIKGLKEDIDVLAEQQVLLREKLNGPKRMRPVKKCGCFKRYDFSSILE